ncbi:hypothetical protein C1141_08585 [Vibrio agarivorans]|nr:hypothetical protein C1141_08585 [Vibrio agarivorans]
MSGIKLKRADVGSTCQSKALSNYNAILLSLKLVLKGQAWILPFRTRIGCAVSEYIGDVFNDDFSQSFSLFIEIV